MLRKISILAAALNFVVVFSLTLSAQNGEPIISTGGVPGGTSASTAYIDAYVASIGAAGVLATDVCQRIQWVYANVVPAGASTTVDARGFTGTGWGCTVNPFAVGSGLTGKSGKLLLGFIDIPAQVTWIIPTRMIVEGIGANGTGLAGANTMIHANSNLSQGPASQLAVIQMGMAGTAANISYGVQVRNLSIDCANTVVSMVPVSGIVNLNAEEGSLVNNVEIFDCPGVGLRVSTSQANSPGHGGVNSGPYSDIFVNYTSCSNCASGTTLALQVDGDATSSNISRSVRGFDNLTVSGNHFPSPKPTLIYVYGASTTITNSHVEYCSGVCIQIGQTGTSPTYDTVGVRLSDVTVGVNNGGYDVQIGNSVPSGVTVGNILVENINHETTTNSNTLKDYVTGNAVPDSYLGWYWLGVGSSSNTTPAVFTSSNDMTTTSGNPFELRIPGFSDFGNAITKPAGSFRIDHPLDPAHEYLYHSFVESPDMMNIYNGSVTTDQHGLATVTLPDYFEALNRDFRYQLTPVGQFAQAIVAEKVKGNRFVIQTDKPGVEVSWQVTGVRHDDYANQHRIPVEEKKPQPLTRQ